MSLAGSRLTGERAKHFSQLIHSVVANLAHHPTTFRNSDKSALLCPAGRLLPGVCPDPEKLLTAHAGVVGLALGCVSQVCSGCMLGNLPIHVSRRRKPQHWLKIEVQNCEVLPGFGKVHQSDMWFGRHCTYMHLNLTILIHFPLSQRIS